MEVVILPSARKHGIADDDILHAYYNSIFSFMFDAHTMLIGPDMSGNLLEVGVVVDREDDLIVHAMSARKKFLRY